MALLAALPAALSLTPAGALAQGFSGFVSPGPLAEAHAELDTITRCTSCHEPGAGVTPRRCMDCHEEIDEQVTGKTGFHAHLGDDCVSCHADHEGRDHKLVQLHKEAFNHQLTGFALRGAHAPLECVECHEAEPDYTGLDSDCRSCHEEPHGAGESTRPLLNQCRLCHDAEAWDALPIPKSVFDHDAPSQADFALHGRHADVACADCHAEQRFVPTPSEACTDCHEDIHRGQFRPRPCEDCHDPSQIRFQLTSFDHDATDYPLIGAHQGVRCASCHGDGRKAQYVDLPHEACSTCHEDVHDGEFAPRDCDACHSLQLASFETGAVDHDATDFPLRGAHVDVGCSDCHGEGAAAVWVDLASSDCDSCHEDVHAARFEPDACSSCHADTRGDWSSEGFDHGRTDYPLTGAHAEAQCGACHGEGDSRQLTGLAYGSCMDCHGEQEPHERALPPEACTDCHGTAAWAELSFDHGTTDFALTHAHADAACADCHSAPAFDQAEQACASCHEEDRPEEHYDGDCAECHEPAGWSDGNLGRQGHGITGFPLRGAHADAACASCHAESRPAFEAAPDCVDCHAADDPHRNLLGDDCSSCHVEFDWLRTRFHHASTGFPLLGNHKAAACDDCHAAGYAGTPEDCVACHEGDRPGDTLHRDPLTRDCVSCHHEWTFWDARFSFGGTP